MFYVWSVVSNRLATGRKIFQESTVCGLSDHDHDLKVAQQLWECVGGIMGAGTKERERDKMKLEKQREVLKVMDVREPKGEAQNKYDRAECVSCCSFHSTVCRCQTDCMQMPNSHACFILALWLQTVLAST